MAEGDLKRKLAAILSADVTEYSRLMREDDQATIRTLTALREVMTTLIKQHHGRVVDAVGDNLLAEFASVVDAVQGAIAIQKEIKSQNAKLPETRRMLFRIGINLGDLVVEGERIYGDGVNIAARLESMADPGGICVSRTAFDQIEDKLPIGYEYLGEKSVKNAEKPVRAYRVLFEPGDETTRIDRSEPEQKTQTKDKAPEDKKNKKEPLYKNRKKSIIQKHKRLYVVVVGFLFIVNMLTWEGGIWFHWPALGWGLILFLQWIHITKGKNTSQNRFHKHLGSYVGIIGFLFIINMLTGYGTIWFHWPALGWGLLLFIHWATFSKSLPK